jgi:hypothetical protein
MALSSEEFCPVSENFLGRLYRSSPEGLAVLVRTIPPNTRAMLAYYCSRRAHLETLGLAIASTCPQEDLYNVAGKAGWDLFARAQVEAFEPAGPQREKSRQGVTLASGSLCKDPAPKE